MTATLRPPLAGPVTPTRVVRSEWTKFRSLRSTWWSVGIALVLTVGLGVLFSAVAAAQPHPSVAPVDVAGRGELGNLVSQLTLGVLAVLLVTGEYGTGMIRSSMTAVPRRLPVLWGKLAVFVAAVLPLSLAASVAAFALGQLVWRATASPPSGSTLRTSHVSSSGRRCPSLSRVCFAWRSAPWSATARPASRSWSVCSSSCRV